MVSDDKQFRSSDDVRRRSYIMEVIIMGLALAFNILVILWKLENRGSLDALLDGMLLGLVMYLAGGTLTGMLVGTIASSVVSAYLLVKRPQFKTPEFKMPSFRKKKKHNTCKRPVWVR